jgi:hypothetical protein
LFNGEQVEKFSQHPSGESMMEQLLPKIMMHYLNYLDYPNLCHISMMNSSMFEVANDNNGCKSYYATKKVVVDVNVDYHNILRENNIVGIRPLWEDLGNRNGGKWIIRLNKVVSGRFWEDLVLAIVGDQLDHGDYVSGIVLSVLKGKFIDIQRRESVSMIEDPLDVDDGE